VVVEIYPWNTIQRHVIVLKWLAHIATIQFTLNVF
jgi:hypothetical protein